MHDQHQRDAVHADRVVHAELRDPLSRSAVNWNVRPAGLEADRHAIVTPSVTSENTSAITLASWLRAAVSLVAAGADRQG